MTVKADDSSLCMAEQVADSLAYRGFAFVEEDQVEALALALREFLDSAGIVVNVVPEAAPAG